MSNHDLLGPDRLGEERTPSLALAGPCPIAEALLPDGRALTLRRAVPADAAAMVDLMHAAFASRPEAGDRPEALAETPASIGRALDTGTGYLAEIDGDPAGTTLVTADGDAARLGRVSVHPRYQRHGVAGFMVGVLLEELADEGFASVSLLSRKEFPQIERWWQRHGFERVGTERNCWVLARALPVVVEVPDADAMRELGRRVAGLVRPGDLIIASGDLGAGKTTFAQGLGAGMGVEGPVISPTFVLSRIHPSPDGGPALVHVDAYRLDSFAEVEDLDLDASLADSVTLVEWGADLAEGLNDARLALDIRRGLDPTDETRWVFLTPVGARWDRAALAGLVASCHDATRSDAS